jgi:hypothetical protein
MITTNDGQINIVFWGTTKQNGCAERRRKGPLHAAAVSTIQLLLRIIITSDLNALREHVDEVVGTRDSGRDRERIFL